MRPVWAYLASALLTSCAAGPNFHRPPAPRADSYLPQPLPATVEAEAAAGDPAQRFAQGSDLPAQWWTLFQSPALNELVRGALANNPTVQAAQAALRQANEAAAAQRGAYFPAVQANYSFSRQRNAVGTLAPTLNSGTPIFNLHTAQVSVTYLFDVFGVSRREMESAQALADAQRYQTEATYLSLTSNVVAAAIQEASLRAQIAATAEIARTEREGVQILRHQYELGSIAMLDVLAQESALAATQAALPVLQKQLTQQRHLISVLAGQMPHDEPAQTFELSALTLPQELPVSIPAELVNRRPDVLAAEAQMHSASAQLGVAIANMLPQITLTANQGGAAEQFKDLFAAGNTFWSAGASLTQTLFQGGTLLHRKRAAEAALDQAGAQYRSVVLTAFQNVADSLTALQSDADAVAASARAEKAAAGTLAAVRGNLELGSTSYLTLLSAQQAYQQAVLTLVQARANRYADTAALFQALGGAWWRDTRLSSGFQTPADQ